MTRTAFTSIVHRHRLRTRPEVALNLDPSAADAADEAMQIVPCRVGGTQAHLYEQSADRIAFTGTSLSVRRKLLTIPGVRAQQMGDTEFTVSFPVETFESVAEIVQPARKRNGKSPVELEAVRARGLHQAA